MSLEVQTTPSSGYSPIEPSYKEPDFTTIPLTDLQLSGKPKKQPRRVLHFSDGILEEYSTDEEDEVDSKDNQQIIDPRTLNWMPWMWYYMVSAAWKTLSWADLCGERLAYFFGITSPKYQYAIDEFNRLKDEEKEENLREEREAEAEKRRQSEQLQSVEVGDGIQIPAKGETIAVDGNINDTKKF
ncbi:protein FAM177A1-like [Tubulanus polymorphus]|uniref:protein FAM177A1-like n=1 Tax=Tubulanus polymorphus TaxID=672921 RepID=UPI003DA5DBB7